jgi:hypothetical protein
MIPLIPLITAIPSIFAAYGKVKELNKSPQAVINKQLSKGGEAALSVKTLESLPAKDFNSLKRRVVVDMLTPVLLPRLKKRGCDLDDLGVIVDCACVLYKLIKGKQ